MTAQPAICMLIQVSDGFLAPESKGGEDGLALATQKIQSHKSSNTKFEDCTMSICAQADLLSSLSPAFKVYRLCSDQNFKLYLATKRARN